MQKRFNVTRMIILAGAAGGTAEVLWVLIYCFGSPLQASLVAEEVTRSFVPQMVGPTAVMTGVFIHYVLAILIAAVAAVAYLRIFAADINEPAIFATSIAALVAIWATNFFVVLPIINPVFVTLMPYTVTLISKIGFGIAMSWIFAANMPALAGETRQGMRGRLALR
jgi:hypothetical protein